jgi:hypothetical protein
VPALLRCEMTSDTCSFVQVYAGVHLWLLRANVRAYVGLGGKEIFRANMSNSKLTSGLRTEVKREHSTSSDVSGQPSSSLVCVEACVHVCIKHAQKRTHTNMCKQKHVHTHVDTYKHTFWYTVPL